MVYGFEKTRFKKTPSGRTLLLIKRGRVAPVEKQGRNRTRSKNHPQKMAVNLTWEIKAQRRIREKVNDSPSAEFTTE